LPTVFIIAVVPGKLAPAIAPPLLAPATRGMDVNVDADRLVEE
jgi:hypothetical protein